MSIQEAIKRCLKEHRDSVVLTCEGTCWCWDLATFLEQVEPQKENGFSIRKAVSARFLMEADPIENKKSLAESEPKQAEPNLSAGAEPGLKAKCWICEVKGEIVSSTDIICRPCWQKAQAEIDRLLEQRRKISQALNLKGIAGEDIAPIEFILAEIDRLNCELDTRTKMHNSTREHERALVHEVTNLEAKNKRLTEVIADHSCLDKEKLVKKIEAQAKRIAQMEYDLAIVHEHTNLADCAEDEHFRDAIKMIRKRTAPYENLELTAGPIYSGEDDEQAEPGELPPLNCENLLLKRQEMQVEIHRLNAEKKAIQELAIGKMQAALDYPNAAIDILHIGITELGKQGEPTPDEILRRGGLLNKLVAENKAQAEQIAELQKLLREFKDAPECIHIPNWADWAVSKCGQALKGEEKKE